MNIFRANLLIEMLYLPSSRIKPELSEWDKKVFVYTGFMNKNPATVPPNNMANKRI